MSFLFFRHFAISIHALREEGDLAQICKHRVIVAISIHALREEGDQIRDVKQTKHRNFYPRPP